MLANFKNFIINISMRQFILIVYASLKIAGVTLRLKKLPPD